MAIVYVRQGENPEICIKKFRREVEKENILRELKERRYHMKPAMVRKADAIKLEKKIKRATRKKRYLFRKSYT